ncbi:hypothetical protein GCM10023238_39550 [Streptomyces heliomycini]
MGVDGDHVQPAGGGVQGRPGARGAETDDQHVDDRSADGVGQFTRARPADRDEGEAGPPGEFTA